MRVAAAVVAVGIVTALGLWAALVLMALAYAVHVFALKLEIREVCGVLTNVTSSLTEAQEQLQGARDRVEVLERARGNVGGSQPPQIDLSNAQALYRRVGLSENCPEFILEAAHRVPKGVAPRPATTPAEARSRAAVQAGGGGVRRDTARLRRA